MVSVAVSEFWCLGLEPMALTYRKYHFLKCVAVGN